MMRRLKTTSLLAMLAVLAAYTTSAQQASMTIIGLSGQNMTVTGSTVYLPAGSYLNHTGNIYVAANQFIAGSAGTAITGNAGSRLHLLGSNQLDAMATAATTLIDVNGLSLDVDVTLYNPQNLSLNDQSFGTVGSGNGANLVAAREFAFAVAHPFTGAAITDNHVLTNSNRFIIGAAGSLTGFNETRYVVTNDNAGELRKLSLATGQSFFFPIGRAEADYTPARAQVASGGGADYYMNVRNFSESIPNESLGGYAAGPNVSRTWMIYASNAATVASLDFIHPGTTAYEVNGYNRTNSNAIRFNGFGWVPNQPSDAENESLAGTLANYWAQQITFNIPAAIGVNSFYGKSNAATPLPVQLGDFTATAQSCEAVLGWTTFTEKNLSHFVVERSYTARANSWESVAKISATGNSSNLRQYNAMDAKAAGSQAFYRLAIIENDGRINYSAVRLVNFNCRTKITGYPNPVKDYFTVLLPQGSAAYTIRVINLAGQEVLTMQKRSAGSVLLPTANLAAGLYHLTITNSDGSTTTLQMLKE